MNGNGLSKEREYLKRRSLERIEKLLNRLDEAGAVRTPEDLRKTELEIVAVTDAMAGEIIQAVVARSVHDRELADQGRILAKKSVSRLKNHGRRKVTVHPVRGDPFTVQATYYCKAGQRLQRAAKKGVSIPS